MKGRGSLEMIVLFTVLRLLAILIVSHDMSGLLKTWKSKCWFIAGSLLLSLFVGGITGSLLALLFCYLFLNKISSSEKNSFLFHLFAVGFLLKSPRSCFNFTFSHGFFKLIIYRSKTPQYSLLCLIS